MEHAMTDEIRHAVKAALVQRRLTQGQLAERIGITPQHLSRMMQGQRSNVPEAWQKVFDELGLELTVRPARRAPSGQRYEPEPLDDETRAWLEADLSAPLEPYEWGGVDPKAGGGRVEYVPGQGLMIVEED